MSANNNASARSMGSSCAQQPISLPSIIVRPPENDVVRRALSILAEQRRVFTRGNQLVSVDLPDASTPRNQCSKPSIRVVNPVWLRLQLSKVAEFYRPTETEMKRIFVPDFIGQLAMEVVELPQLRVLRALTETEVFLSDGSIHAVSGLDEGTGIYFAPLGGPASALETPTHDDAKNAASALLDLVSDFPFEGDRSRAAWLALLLTLVARFAIPGPVPFWLIDANGQSAGKGLLTQISSIIALGRDPIARVASKDGEEFRKNVLSILMDGERLAWLDEVDSPFGGRRWNALMTTSHYQDRVLGTPRTWSGPHLTVWVASGNNVQLSSDTPRRCVHVRLEPREERPEDRGCFKLPDIISHVKQHRESLLGHVLTMLRAYHQAGRPAHELTPWGSFEEWSRLVRECVFWCTGVDCDTRALLTQTADSSRENSGVLLESLETLFPNRKIFLAADVLTAYEKRDEDGCHSFAFLREALDAINTNPRGLNARGIGNLLKAKRNRNFGGRILEGVPGNRSGMHYRVVPAKSYCSEPGNSESPVPTAPRVEGGEGDTGVSGESEFPSPVMTSTHSGVQGGF